MPNPGPARGAKRIAGALMMAAGLLFVVLWTNDRSTSTRLIVGGLLLMAGMISYLRAGRSKS
jgi:hypothetical protein